MKRLFTFITIILITISVFAQSPQKLSYQAVIRNSDDALVANTEIGMQISIIQGSTFGASVYVETQTPTTNANGLVSIEIGSDDATVVHGSLSELDWADGPYFIKTETDPAGGTNYSISGISQLLSVPFALYAKTAETVTGGVSETDPLFSESEAANITETDITNLSNLSGTNTGDQDLTELATKTALTDSIAKVRTEIGASGGSVGTETDPVFTASKAVYITADDITNLGNLSGTNTGDQDLSSLASKTALADSTAKVRGEGVYTAGTGISVANNVISVAGSDLSIGDSYQGGIIFWLDVSGTHGLIVSTTDLATGVTWANGSNKITGTVGDGLYSGKMNTAMIVAGLIAETPTGNFAAKACADYSVTADGVKYGDWYLPSKYELNLLYSQMDQVSGLSGTYWSSCEYNSTTANAQNFTDGTVIATDKQGTSANVRAVRAF